MSTNTIDSTAAAATSQRRPAKPEGGRKSAKSAKAKPAKKSRQPKAGAHAKARRANKKADVIDLSVGPAERRSPKSWRARAGSATQCADS